MKRMVLVISINKEEKDALVKAFPPNRYPHYYCYQCLDAKTLPEPQWKKEPAVTWEDVETTGFSSSKKPFDYWLSLRQSPEKIKIYRTVPKGQNFGVEIRISVPAESKVDLACTIKALLDEAHAEVVE